MPRINIYLSPELHKSVRDVQHEFNWSQIAQAAFAKAIRDYQFNRAIGRTHIRTTAPNGKKIQAMRRAKGRGGDS